MKGQKLGVSFFNPEKLSECRDFDLVGKVGRGRFLALHLMKPWNEHPQNHVDFTTTDDGGICVVMSLSLIHI